MDYRITIKELGPEHTASVRGMYPIAQLPEIMAREFGHIATVLAAEGVAPAGGVLAIYHGWTEDTVDVEIAFTIHGVYFPRDPHGEVQPSRVPGGKAVFTVHVGPYDRLAEAYEAIQEYAKANGLKLAGVMWERYLTGPAEEPDLSMHVTEVYWPLA